MGRVGLLLTAQFINSRSYLGQQTHLSTKKQSTEKKPETQANCKHDQVINNQIESCLRTKKVTFKYELFDVEDFKYLSNCLKKLPEGSSLKKFKLRDCNVTETSLKHLSEGRIQATKLDFSANKQLDVRSLMVVFKTWNSESLNLNDCALNAEDMEILSETPIVELKLNYKAFTCSSISTALGQVLKNGLKKLELADSPISWQDLKVLAQGPRIPLQSLDLSHIRLGEEGAEAVAGIVNRTDGMQRLGLSNCGITTRGLKKFCDKIEKKVDEIDFSYNKDIDEDGEHLLGLTVERCKTGMLDISGRRLSGSCLCRLKDGKPQEIREVDLSENPGIETSEVAKLAADWKLESLNISECQLEAEDLNKFRTVGTYKLKYLDVSEPTECPSDEKIQAIINLTEYVSERILLRCRYLSKQQKQTLQNYSHKKRGPKIVTQVVGSLDLTD